MYKYDKDKIKKELTITQVADLLASFGGEPQILGDKILSKTICHNKFGEECSHKLYYYENSQLFTCYTNCGTGFDIYELVCKVKKVNNELKQYYDDKGNLSFRDWELYDAIEFIAIYFGYTNVVSNFDGFKHSLPDEEVFARWNKTKATTETKRVEFKVFNPDILKNLPTPRIAPWEEEGISKEVMKMRGIAYNPRTHAIVIPHYDIDNHLIGIRERTLVKEDEQYGKYKPSILNGIMYNHPLGFNLYNLNNSKKNIKLLKKAVVFEGEKSPLLLASYIGPENDFSVACCGSNLINYQVNLLLSLGVEEIIIGFDKQYKAPGDDEYQKWTKKLEELHTKYGAKVQISYLFDTEGLLGYKDSPIDKGLDIFMELFENRIFL